MFTVHFTSDRPIKKYDAKGKVVSVDPIGTPMTVTPCSKETALLYKDCPNFRMEEIVRVFTKSGPPVLGVGNGTRKVKEKVYAPARSASKTVGSTTLEKAAMTGDMSGALNE